MCSGEIYKMNEKELDTILKSEESDYEESEQIEDLFESEEEVEE